MRNAVIVVLALMLGACATAPAPVPPGSPSARGGSSAGSTPAVTTPAPSAGSGARIPQAVAAPVDDLLSEARRYRDAGDLASSFARLERALRMAPQRAEVYLELARNHSAAGNAARASASAERGLLYCDGASCRALQGFLQP